MLLFTLLLHFSAAAVAACCGHEEARSRSPGLEWPPYQPVADTGSFWKDSLMNARWTQRNPRWTWLAAASILRAVDQATKSHFSTTLVHGEVVPVTEWLNFEYGLW